jgi:hypothetical protein
VFLTPALSRPIYADEIIRVSSFDRVHAMHLEENRSDVLPIGNRAKILPPKDEVVLLANRLESCLSHEIGEVCSKICFAKRKTRLPSLRGRLPHGSVLRFRRKQGDHSF